MQPKFKNIREFTRSDPNFNAMIIRIVGLDRDENHEEVEKVFHVQPMIQVNGRGGRKSCEPVSFKLKKRCKLLFWEIHEGRKLLLKQEFPGPVRGIPGQIQGPGPVALSFRPR